MFHRTPKQAVAGRGVNERAGLLKRCDEKEGGAGLVGRSTSALSQVIRSSLPLMLKLRNHNYRVVSMGTNPIRGRKMAPLMARQPKKARSWKDQSTCVMKSGSHWFRTPANGTSTAASCSALISFQFTCRMDGNLPERELGKIGKSLQHIRRW